MGQPEWSRSQDVYNSTSEIRSNPRYAPCLGREPRGPRPPLCLDRLLQDLQPFAEDPVRDRERHQKPDHVEMDPASEQQQAALQRPRLDLLDERRIGFARL